MKHFLTLKDLGEAELRKIIDLSFHIKQKPQRYRKAMRGKQIVMIFEKPSLRTRLSFELGMQQMGGNAVFYSKEHSTLGSKETWEDFARVVSKYCNGIVCRLYEHSDIEKIAGNSSVPVMNALTNDYHPFQAIADFMTIFENKKTFKVKIAYLGDAKNNVTHSLMMASKMLGATMAIACPKRYEPLFSVFEETKSCVTLYNNAADAVKDADFVYTDSWMSYQIPEKDLAKRKKMLQAYQINEKLLALAPNALIMHCLPAARGMEITAPVLEGKQSIVFQQAENRLHTTKAVLLRLLK